MLEWDSILIYSHNYKVLFIWWYLICATDTIPNHFRTSNILIFKAHIHTGFSDSPMWIYVKPQWCLPILLSLILLTYKHFISTLNKSWGRPATGIWTLVPNQVFLTFKNIGTLVSLDSILLQLSICSNGSEFKRCKMVLSEIQSVSFPENSQYY